MNKKQKLFRITILFVVVTALTIIYFVNNFEKPWVTCQDFYTPGLSKNYFSDGKVRLRDDFDKKYLTPKYDWISDVRTNDSITVYCNNGKRGYLNWRTGKVVLEPLYERAWIFSEGLAGVVQNNKLGFIDKTGKLIIEPQFQFVPGIENRVDFVFKNGFCTAIDSTGLHGLINKEGDWVLIPQYQYINNPVIGYRIVKNNEKYGVLNPFLDLCLPAQYDMVEILKDGFKVADSGIQKLIDFDGQTVLQDTIFNRVEGLHLYVGFDQNNSPMYVDSGFSVFWIEDKVGVINKQGKVIIPAIYSNVRMLNKDNFLCTKAGFGIILDLNGKEV